MAKDNFLSPFLKERLRLSAIAPAAARHAGLRAMTVAAAREAGYPLPGHPTEGFLLPYHDAAGKLMPGMWRWRNIGGSKGCKYAQPANSGCRAYFPRVQGLDWRKVLVEPRIPVFVVEGELKALSLCLHDVLAVGLGGVWNWLVHKELLPELVELAKGGRELWIAFDSDTEDKDPVKQARYQLAKRLLDVGAEVHWLALPHLADPEGPNKTGVDDLVRVWRLRGEKLQARLAELEAKEGFAIQQHLLRLNAEYLFNRQSGRVHEAGDPTQSWDDMMFARVIENSRVTVGQKIGKGGKVEDVVTKLGRAWLDWPARNTVEGWKYEPRPQDTSRSPYVTLDGKRYLNAWTGWASVPEPDPEGVAKYWTRLLDHLFQWQGSESAEQRQEREHARQWFEMWWAYPIQHPAAKLYSAAALLGAQGGGKTLVGYMVHWACYGAHFREITQEQLDSRFNSSYAANRSLIMGSEVTSVADWKKQRNVSEVLKHWITGKKIDIEGKHKDSYESRNLINLYLTANRADAFFIEGDDRRYFVHQIPDVKLAEALGNAWVDEADAYAQSDRGKAALHYHLLNLKIDRQLFDPRGSPPDTEAKRNAREYSQNTAEQWLAMFCEAPEEFSGRQRGQQVFRLEEAHAAFLRATSADPKAWPIRSTFARVFRTKFYCLGREQIAVFKGKPYDSVTKSWVPCFEKRKTSLWVRKPSYKAGEPRGCMTRAEAKTEWRRQQAKDFPTLFLKAQPDGKHKSASLSSDSNFSERSEISVYNSPVRPRRKRG